MHELKKKTNPCKVYTVGEWLESPGKIEPDQHITYSTSKGCGYILRNVGGLTISSGTSARVLFEIIADNGSQYIELANPVK